jgi:membrane-bound lytic murein transglycosylase D
MAAYNCGPLCVARAVERTGYADVWELRRRNALPRETSNYIPIILAMVIMAKNPNQYDLSEIEAAPPLEFSTITVTAATDVQLIADITERPLAAIRELNPALLTTVAPTGFPVHVPAGSSATVLSALELIPPEKRTAWRLYRVAEGDTAERIAQLFRTTPRQIALANPKETGLCEPGSLLIVPAAPKGARKTAQSQVAAKKSPVRRQLAKKTTPAKQAPSAAKKPSVTAAAAKKAPLAKTTAAAKTATSGPGSGLVASKRNADTRPSTLAR